MLVSNALEATNADLLLIVQHEQRDNDLVLRYQLGVQSPQLGPTLYDDFPKQTFFDAFKRLKSLFLDLGEWQEEKDDDARLRDQRRLDGLGVDVYEQLLPKALRAKLWELRERWGETQDAVPTLQLLSDETLVPWELLKLQGPSARDEGPFLVEAFAFTRWLLNHEQVLELPLNEIGLVVPSRSAPPAAFQERDFLRSLRSSERTVTEVPARYNSLIEQLAAGRCDGWHFAGHGLKSGEHADRWGLVLEEDDELTAQDLKSQARRLGETRPLVFASACHSGGGGPGLTRFGGMARSFLEVGAGAFIGSRWAFTDEPAFLFARAFYELFLAGEPLGRAVRQARSQVREAFPGDPSWLAPSVFGHPQARCSELSEASRVPRTRDVEGSVPLVIPNRRWHPDRSPPGALLRPDYGIVPFHGRSEELADLHSWCQDDAEIGVRLYHGAGGMGKTRLALEICRLLAKTGWRAGFLADLRTTEETRRIFASRAFVVVDYAEMRRDLVLPLLRELCGAKVTEPIRVLLLARSARDWWRQLKAEGEGVGELLIGPATSVHRLEPLALLPEERGTSYNLAAMAFSECLGKPLPGPPGNLTAPHYERVLLLHMSALVAIEGIEAKGEDGIFDETLRREERFWKRLTQARGLAVDLVPGIGRAMAAITMAGGVETEDGAVALLERMPFFRGQNRSVLVSVARLLHDCYPGERWWIESVLPDLLGDHLVDQEMQRGSRELLELVLDD